MKRPTPEQIEAALKDLAEASNTHGYRPSLVIEKSYRQALVDILILKDIITQQEWVSSLHNRLTFNIEEVRKGSFHD